MGLFSNKKAQADGFSFAVDEVYALKEGKSVVVTGKMTSGKSNSGNGCYLFRRRRKAGFPLHHRRDRAGNQVNEDSFC